MTQKSSHNGYLIDEFFYKKFPKSELVMDKTTPYSCTLNQTDVENNNNKFYMMQLLEENKKYNLCIKYGRVGDKGSIITKNYTSEKDGINAFRSQFRTKTKNSWENKDNFTRYKGKYYLISICDKIEDNDSEEEISETYDFDDDVKYFLQLISDKKMLDRCLVSMDIDTKKMPLGKINSDNIQKARKVLQNISKSLNKPKLLVDLSSEYYTYIPYCCGRSKPPVVKTKEMVDKLEDTLDYLENISFNVQIQKRNSGGSPLSNLYDSINTQIISLSEKDHNYNIINKYFINSQGDSHKRRFSLDLKNIYAIRRPDARAKFEAKYKDTSNHQLLIHGSPICNWVSILKNGLMLDPSKLGVTITGKMFGYGIYWANSFSKSAQYCGGFWGNSGRKETICFTLAQVALGKEKKMKYSDWSMCKSRLDSGCESVWGIGKNTPSDTETLEGESVIVPNGKLSESGPKDCSLIYDEKIVYDSEQFDLRFIVIAEMTFK